jgi:hypothetical protein
MFLQDVCAQHRCIALARSRSAYLEVLAVVSIMLSVCLCLPPALVVCDGVK